MSIEYPTAQQVEDADRRTLCYWWRFLPSPGENAIGNEEFAKIMAAEKVLIDRIAERLQLAGGFTPEISKSIGWEKP